MSGLTVIAEKDPIVSTFGVDALASIPAEVCASYDWHAATYIEQPAMGELSRGFVEAVHARTTPKSCLVAPFGYGKTSAAIGVWHACRHAGFLAVPPISCNSFTDIARAVRDWLRFVLSERDDVILAAYERFLVGSSETLAQRDQQQFDIPFDQALAAIRDKVERGYLDFEDITVNLLGFLEEATALAEQAGHRGLVVIVDELQQLVGNADKGVLVALRQLIWGLRTRQLPLGLMVTMDPDTERTLADRAGDILHRIKDDGLYLDIRHAYDREFPARLWAQYAQALDLPAEAATAIDRPTLEAVGQLCERDDLSNGPRTAINVLQRAAQRRQEERNKSYSPIDLIDDILDGEIRFAGDRSLLSGLLTELLSYPYFQRSLERVRALKLLAAFPRGCPPNIAEDYGLGQVCQELDDDLRGEILMELDEGLALIGLQRVGRPANRLNLLLRRYWMQITDRGLIAEDAPRVFAELVLPLLFPSKLHDLNGWTGVEDVTLSVAGDYTGVLEGTTSSAYPLRRIAVRVAGVEQPPTSPWAADDVDYWLTFRLDLSADARSSLTADPATRSIEFVLGIARPTESGLGGGLSWIEHYLRPQPVSAAMVMSLLRFFAAERASDVGGRDQARIEDTLARLRQWMLAELIPPELFSGAGYSVTQAGIGALQEFMYLFATRLWPEYRTLVVHTHWSELLDDYERALERVAPTARTGALPVQDTKSFIGQLFGKKRHAGFESRARQYGELLRVERWQADTGTVRFAPLSSELDLADQVRDAGGMHRSGAYKILRTSGFAASEANRLLGIVVARGLLVEHDGMLRAPDVPSRTELLAQANALAQQCAALPEQHAELSSEVQAIVDAISRGDDLIEVKWRIDAIDERMTVVMTHTLAEAQGQRDAVRAQLQVGMSRLVQIPLPSEAGQLENHLFALHRIIEDGRRRLALAVSAVLAEDPLQLAEGLALAESIDSWSELASLFARWAAFTLRATRLQAALLRLGSSEGALGVVTSEVESVVRRARAILAREGTKGLVEIGQFEADLSSVEVGFRQAEDERTEAYARVARSLSAQLVDLFSLPAPLELPPYDAEEDGRSFEALSVAISAAASRSLALLQLNVADDGRSRSEKLAIAKLRADIKNTAQRAGDPAWLLTGAPLALRRDAVRTIRALVNRVERPTRETNSSVTTAGSQIARVLASLPGRSIDLIDVFERTDGVVARADVIAEIVRLVDANGLRLSLELCDQ